MLVKRLLPEWQKGHFKNLKANNKNITREYIVDFFKIYTKNVEHNWKNFKLFPEFRAGRHFLNYDKAAFYQVLVFY